ncbi:DegT/DnrJ/EryC1/StrS aminotransferase family protein [Methylocystis sp. ATCC 49242]|uniref:DegT/DnrJ/EryC1/StrS family aminotransferase n=1 Tax=Methylocystis sp. ATCC 49242 TaxID=622637 RepID=UPI0001F868C1|nr:DegT/DnrJ/EryC1/StrS family aminotransferase [Methylocystis sp. ATCC 49242]
MTIPFYDLSDGHREIREAIDAVVATVVDGGHLILGPQLEAFEAEFAAFCEARYCVGVSDGLSALTLALKALDVGVGDEVIVPTNTFIATWLAVSATGATPVGAEPDPITLNIDPSRIEAAITSRTRCIIPVHLYGQPADMGSINAIAARHGLAVLEDSAQAHGATIAGRPVGGLGTIGAFSFYPTKNLGALGDGGAVVTNDEHLARRLRLLRNYGSTVKYRHEILGVNSRLDELQAAVLRVKLRRLPAWNHQRQHLASYYSHLLANSRHVKRPSVAQGVESVWHLYVVRVPKGRDRLIEHLRINGVQTLVHYPCPPHRQAAYASLALPEGAFPLAEALAAEVMSLPFWPQMPHAFAKTVTEAIATFDE